MISISCAELIKADNCFLEAKQMPGSKNRFYIFKHAHLQVIGTICILLLALALLWHGNATGNQPAPALVAQVFFDGEYRIADGPWQEIVGVSIFRQQKAVSPCAAIFIYWPQTGNI